MAMPTELDSPAALPLQSGTSFTAPYIVVDVRMPESNIELNSGTMIDIPKSGRLVMAASARLWVERGHGADPSESDDPQSQCSVHEKPQPDDPDIAAHHTHMGDHGGVACFAGTLIDHL